MFFFNFRFFLAAILLHFLHTAAAQNNGSDHDQSLFREEMDTVNFEVEPEITRRFPQKNIALLRQVKTLHNEPELQSYLRELKKVISSKMNATSLSEVSKLINLYSDDNEALAVNAVVSFYNGTQKEGLLLNVEACLKYPSDHLMLNNLAAILNLSGSEHRSLPLLRMLVNQHPKNSMVLNNLGQAYTGLGELDSAMKYFRRCIEEVPNHPEANNTAGEIEASRGNMEKAEDHFNRSANGGFTDAAMDRMNRRSRSAINYSNHISRFVRPKIKLPDIFNAYKYKPIRQITNVEEAKSIMEEHMQFEEFMHNVLEMYGELIQKEKETGNALYQKNMLSVAKNPNKYAGDMGKYISPFAAPAGNIYSRLAHAYRLRKEDLARYRKQREAVIHDLQLAMEEQMNKNVEDYSKCLDETTCKDCNPEDVCKRSVLYPLNNKAANDFLVKAAAIREEIQQKELLLAKETYENLAYFGYLAGPNKHLAKANFYKACYDYVAAILQADETAFVAKAGDEGKPFEPNAGGTDAPADMGCPVNLKFDWGVAKFELSCDKFKISGLGGTIKGSRNAKTKQSTLQIGIELSKDFKKKIGNVEGTIKAGMEESIYITVDDQGSFVDAGLAFDLKAGASSSAGIKAGNGMTGKGDSGTDGSIFGYTIGVNSGWTFKEGIVTGIIDSSIGVK